MEKSSCAISGVIPKPPAEFSAFATANCIFSVEMISCRKRATKARPGEAKMSPMKRIFMNAGGLSEERSASTSAIGPVLDPRSQQGRSPPSVFRLLHGGSEPPELAHQRINRVGPQDN